MYKYLSLIFVVFLYSCENKTLSDEKLIAVIKDVRLAYAVANSSEVDRDSIINVLFPKVLELHGLTEEEYNENMDFLKSDINKGLEIETEVAKQLKELKKAKATMK